MFFCYLKKDFREKQADLKSVNSEWVNLYELTKVGRSYQEK